MNDSRQPTASPSKRFFLRTGAVAAKEFLHIRRDARTLYLALGMPVILLLVFGFGVSFDNDHLPVSVLDQDQTLASRALIRQLGASGDFFLTPIESTVRAESGLRRGDHVAALLVPRGYENDVLRKRRADLQLLVDGADGVTANQVLTKADALSRTVGKTEARAKAPPVEVRTWTRFNPAGRSVLFMVPGLAAYLLAIGAVLLTALTVAGEWERGSMEQLFASPVGRFEIVLGKLLPYLALGVLQFLLVLGMGASIFELPIRGSLTLLFAMGLLFLVGMLGQGLLISIMTKNQLVATQVGALSALLPSMLFSGMLFPLENMPRVLQILSHAVPARYLVHGLRGVLLKGNGWVTLWPDLLALAAFALVIVMLSAARFQRRVA